MLDQLRETEHVPRKLKRPAFRLPGQSSPRNPSPHRSKFQALAGSFGGNSGPRSKGLINTYAVRFFPSPLD